MIFLEQFFSNRVIIASVISWAIAQLIKIILDLISTNSINWELIFSSGGMPSSHSAFVCTLAVMTGLYEGFDSVVFAITFAFAAVVMYDAAGVRRAAGSHAAVINKLMESFNIKLDEKLKEFIGHTPIQVGAGAVLGIVIAIISYNLFE